MAYVNIAAIGATSFRSDRLGPLDSVAHPLNAGTYRGEVWRDDVRFGSFVLEVADAGDGEQIDVDLCSVEKSHACDVGGAAAYRSGAARGYPVFAVFHCSSGIDGLYVLLHDQGEQGLVFDSRVLQQGDYYIVTPVRPGAWTMRTGKAGKGMLHVSEPKPVVEPRASAAGASIRVDGKSFNPAKADIVAGDGVAFEITGQDVAILLELERIEEKKKKGPRKIGIRIPGRADVAEDDRKPRTAA